MQADSRQTDFCTNLSAILLGGLLLNRLFGWWWADPVAGLAIISDHWERKALTELGRRFVATTAGTTERQNQDGTTLCRRVVPALPVLDAERKCAHTESPAKTEIIPIRERTGYPVFWLMG